MTANPLTPMRRIVGTCGLAGAVLAAGILIASPQTADATLTKAQPAQEAPIVVDAVDVDADAERPELEWNEQDFAAYDACLETELGAVFDRDETTHDADHVTMMSEAEFDALAAQWEAADAACNDLLPEGFAEQAEAWEAELDAQFEAFDSCLADNGVHPAALEASFEADIDVVDGEVQIAEAAASIFVVADDDETATLIEFGEGEASVTITQGPDGLTISPAGNATTIDLASMDEGLSEDDHAEIAAFETCEALLPADVLVELDEIDGGGFWFEDEFLEDEFLNDEFLNDEFLNDEFLNDEFDDEEDAVDGEDLDG